ncbi:MAG: hypothetical protein ACJA09_000252 [Alcanivorax sp.]|jgi:hypothetical protein
MSGTGDLHARITLYQAALLKPEDWESVTMVNSGPSLLKNESFFLNTV